MKSVKLVATRENGRKVLLVRRRRDGRWTFPGGKRASQHEGLLACLRRELAEELPKVRLGACRLWKKLDGTNERSGRRMNDAVFVGKRLIGRLTIGDVHEIDRAAWRRPWRLALTPTSRFVRDRLVSEGYLER